MPIVVAIGMYFLIALVCGFAFGTLRQFALLPALGPTWAVAAELPLILTALWFGCGFAIRRAGLGQELGPRATMGAGWFVLFLIAEFVLGAMLRGWAPADTLAHFASPPGALGLLGFVCAALFPLWAARR